VAKIKDKEPNPDSESDSENTGKRQIIDADPTAIVVTAAIQLEELIDPDWLKRSKPSSHRFVTDFHKLSNMTSLARQAAHQDADSTNVFPSPPGTQCNGDH
jgi:hypothetical protein